MANKKLSDAKKAKNDEFYTQLADIQREVNAYLEQVVKKISSVNGVASVSESGLISKYAYLNNNTTKTSQYLISELEDKLDANTDEIYLCGTCTDICVISVALNLKARFPEIKMYCIAGLCAGLTPEKHAAALEVMRSCQIEVI